MTDEIKKELIEQASSDVHKAWCEGELRAFYARFTAEMEKGETNSVALFNACFKNGKPRNILELDTAWLQFHEGTTTDALKTFEGFMGLINRGVIEVKRFTGRKLTEEEQKRAGNGNYNPETQEENILREFKHLSLDSKKENIQASIGAVKVYEEYLKRGYTLEQLRSEEMRAEIGTLIHADWMSRNKINSSNEHLFVPFAELDDWTKQQDLDVFYAVLDAVDRSPEKYMVERVDGLNPINAQNYEKAVLSVKDNDEYWLKNTHMFDDSCSK